MKKSLYTQKADILREMLRQLRQNAGLQQGDLADLLDYHQPFISRYERGERRLDLIELSTICRACGSELSTFVLRYETRLKEEGLL